MGSDILLLVSHRSCTLRERAVVVLPLATPLAGEPLTQEERGAIVLEVLRGWQSAARCDARGGTSAAKLCMMHPCPHGRAQRT
jgi:hypothetical protein